MKQNEKPLQIKSFYPNYFGGRLIAYVCLSVTEHLNSLSQIHATAMGFSSDVSIEIYKKELKLYSDVFPKLVWSLIKSILNEGFIKRIAEIIFFLSLKKNDIVYLWPDVTLNLYKMVKRKGCILITERINTIMLTSKKLLDSEYIANGLQPSHDITQQRIEEEIECMKLADYIFSPSTAVTQSIIDIGVMKEKIIETSYGLKKEQLLLTSVKQKNNKKLTVLFVGTICIRKGVHLLLQAWNKLDVDAHLRIVGRISSELNNIVENALYNDTSIEYIPFVEDLLPIYEDSDIFVLPSIEEGSPLVTYLALGASIPIVASHMGAGGVITNGQEGFIIEPHDIDNFSRVLKIMLENEELRLKMKMNARKTAENYTWDKVAHQRGKELISRIAQKNQNY